MKEIFKQMDTIVKPQPYLGFDIEVKDTTIYDSKIGGIPYWPKDKEYPKDEFGNNLYLLVQLNFDKLPHIPNFPEKGMLQFFIANDDLYGMNWDDNTIQENFRIIYHETISDDTVEVIPEYTEDTLLPMDRDYLLIPREPSEMPIDPYDYRWDNHYDDVADKAMGDLSEEEWDQCYERTDRPTVYIGGYPIFTQYDPREGEKSYERYDTILLQCDSARSKDKGVDFMWGDCGIGVFMIPLKNLQNLDFSKVLYYYDCC